MPKYNEELKDRTLKTFSAAILNLDQALGDLDKFEPDKLHPSQWRFLEDLAKQVMSLSRVVLKKTPTA